MSLGTQIAKVKKTGAAAAVALMATFSTASDGHAQAAKAPVSLGEYCSMQADEFSKPEGQRNLAAVFQNYSPYRRGENVIDINTVSDVHGELTLSQFNCETLFPYCPNPQTRAVLVTEGALSIAHAGLGRLNESDPPSVKKALQILARSTKLVTADNGRAIDHLSHYHGLHFFDVNGPSLTMTGQMRGDIVPACMGQLNREPS